MSVFGSAVHEQPFFTNIANALLPSWTVGIVSKFDFLLRISSVAENLIFHKLLHSSNEASYKVTQLNMQVSNVLQNSTVFSQVLLKIDAWLRFLDFAELDDTIFAEVLQQCTRLEYLNLRLNEELQESSIKLLFDMAVTGTFQNLRNLNLEQCTC